MTMPSIWLATSSNASVTRSRCLKTSRATANCSGSARALWNACLKPGRVDVVRLALQCHQPLGQLVKLGGIAADVAKQRDRLGSHRRRFGDEGDDVLHLGPKLAELVEVDRPRGGEHLVDGIVHGADQRGDRAAVERRQEGLPDRGQDFADDVVGAVLMLLDRLEQFVRRRGVRSELLQRIRSRDQRHGMGFEHAEKVAALGQQPLKPGEHRRPSTADTPVAFSRSRFAGDR